MQKVSDIYKQRKGRPGPSSRSAQSRARKIT